MKRGRYAAQSAPGNCAAIIAFGICITAAFTGCRTVPELPPADLSEPGWTVRQGQAVWKPNRNAPEIAGEIVVATSTNAQAMVQFIKTPFAIAVGQMTSNRWQIQFPSENRVFRGPGTPPARLAWLQLLRGLNALPMGGSWQFEEGDGSTWLLHNSKTGETVSGYFLP